jgi:DNA-binding MarR family transcriptional regulator
VTHDALLVDGSDSMFRELINNLLLMSKQLQGLRTALAKQLRVSEPQYRVLLTVSKRQGDAGVSVTAVAKHLHVTGAFVTAESGKLVTNGFLQKREDPTDRRSVLLSLTNEGNAALVAFASCPQAVNDELFRDFTREEFVFLSETVRRLVGNGERAALVARALSSNDSDGDFIRRFVSHANRPPSRSSSTLPARPDETGARPTTGKRPARH